MIFNDIVNAGHTDGIMKQSFRTLKGTTGTDNFNGQIIGEDENKEWDDPSKSVENVDIMRKSCVRVRQSMMLLKTPILGASMRIEPASEDNVDIKIAEFVENNLFDSPFFRWDDVISQQMTYLDHGHSILEKAYKRHKGQIWLSNLEFRKQKTVFEWDAPLGQLKQVRQTQFNITSERDPEPMPAEQIILSTYEKEGNNFAGFPAVRPAWINWKAKMFLIKGDMVSYERFRMGIPMITTKKSGEIPDDAIDALKDLRSNSEGFIAATKDWELGIFGGGRQMGGGVLEMVAWHDHQIVFNVMGNFMTKGEGATGSFALTRVGADMFFCNVEREANRIENIWNEPSGLMSQIPQLVEFNFPGAAFPKLRIENLKFNDLDGFAERLTKYSSADAMDMTDDIKRWIREREKAPLLGLDEEQLEGMANIAPTIKRIDGGRPYVLQYSRGKGGRILRLQGAKKTTPVSAERILKIVQSKKKRRGKKMTEELLLLEKKIVDAKGIEKFLNETQKDIEKIAQKHRDDFTKFLIKEGEKILVDSNSVEQIESKLNKTELEIDLFIEQVNKEVDKVFRFGIKEMKAEIAKQKPVGLFNIGDPITESLDEAKKSILTSIRIGLSAFASKTIAEWQEAVFDLYKRSELSTDFIRTRLERVSQKVLNSKLGAFSNNSFGLGRGVQMQKIKEPIEKIVHTEVLDENTCSPCLASDGLEFKSMDDPEFSKFANGQNPECLGADRCRGFNFVVI